MNSNGIQTKWNDATKMNDAEAGNTRNVQPQTKEE
jgi:hypothetical protein